jgi:sugar phosphate isomerase/epimerase
MHVHDAKDKSDHLPLGAGELDLPKYFYLAKIQDCRIVLETKTVSGLKESIEWIKNQNRNAGRDNK